MIGLQYGLVWKCWENSIPFMGYIIIMFASSRVAIFWIVPHFQTPKWLSQKWSNMQIPWFGRLANGCETQDIGCCSLRTTCWRIAILLPCSRHDFESSWALPENWWKLMKIGYPWTGWFSLKKKSCHFQLPFSVASFWGHVCPRDLCTEDCALAFLLSKRLPLWWTAAAVAGRSHLISHSARESYGIFTFSKGIILPDACRYFFQCHSDVQNPGALFFCWGLWSTAALKKNCSCLKDLGPVTLVIAPCW